MSLWTKEYEPLTAQELVVNKTKVLEISDFLADAFNKGNDEVYKRSVLIISGPNGCGKTTLLRCICKKMNINILEWETPFGLKEGLGTSFFRFITNLTFFSSFRTEPNGLILIKDFPNTLIQYNKQILDEIKHFLSNSNQAQQFKVPIVFISTESREDRNFLKLILPGNFDILEDKTKPIIKQNFRNIKIKLVKLNPIPSTVLRTTLKKILKQGNIHIGGSEDYLIEQVCHASNGDMSHAINLLQFLFIENHKKSTKKNIIGGFNIPSSQISKKRSKLFLKITDDVHSDEKNRFLFGKEPTYNIFRTIGKILYNKREKIDNNFSSVEKFDRLNKKQKNEEFLGTCFTDSNSVNMNRYISEKIFYFKGFEGSDKPLIDSIEDGIKLINRGKVSFDLEDVLIHSGNDEETLILFLQENYIPFIGNCIDLIKCSEIFSWSDYILSSKLLPNNEDHLHLLVLSCISRTILYFNSIPVNPCSTNSKTQTDEKVGFTNKFLPKRKNCLNNSIYLNNEENFSRSSSIKSVFRWHPKKPFYKTFVSDSKNIKENFQILINENMHFNTNINTINYFSFNKTLFVDIFPYLNYIFMQNNNKLGNLSPHFNHRFLSFARDSSRYTKHVLLSHELLVNELNVNSDNNIDTVIGEYLSDEQLVSILETCEADIYDLLESKTQNTCSLNIKDRCGLENSVSSDDSIDDNFY
ncbi:RAD24/Rf-C activator 1 AAA ATpase [Cryptosporidium ryanae]|uniref:RAD24/Rf-C activator 1 AAA ATpase n=1 Tax=Cryptosporidium ryanae TaxID=515981 RepID=UPI00351A51B8|nr:RAD24/Rf-C activator 1 AAA ATpase [Cryptosporidium ryanae]